MAIEMQPISKTPPLPEAFGVRCVNCFVSHSVKQKRLAHEVKERLGRFGFRAFVAHDDIAVTEEWQDEIDAALWHCGALIWLCTPDAAASAWCNQEVGYAVARGKVILTAAIGTDPPGFLARKQALQSDDPLKIAESLYERAKRHAVLKQKVGSSLVHRLSDATSFDDANRIAKLIKEHLTFDGADLRRAQLARKSSSQVSGAWEVDSAIQHIRKNVKDED